MKDFKGEELYEGSSVIFMSADYNKLFLGTVREICGDTAKIDCPHYPLYHICKTPLVLKSEQINKV